MTRKQLEKAVDDVFYLAQEMFAYYSWVTKIEPKLQDLPTPFHSTLVRNAVIEAQLMFYRKLNEFFCHPNPRFPDDLKSELFGFPATGGFICKADVEELHKRVAHPTTLEAVHGKVSYEIYDTSHTALNHVLPFFKFLTENFYAAGSRESRSLIASITKLCGFWHDWSLHVDASKRKTISFT
jgi:hypothetical protein